MIVIDNDFKKNFIRGENVGIDVYLLGGYMVVVVDLRMVVINVINVMMDVNRLIFKVINNIIFFFLYNLILGYEFFIMLLVFIIIF